MNMVSHFHQTLELVVDDEHARRCLSAALANIRFPALEPCRRRRPVVVRLTSHQVGAHSILLSKTGQARDGKWVARHEVGELDTGIWSVPDDLAQEKGFL